MDWFENGVLQARPVLMRVALKMRRNHHDAEDAVSETMLRALAARDRFTQGTNLNAWLTTILKNLVITGARRTRTVYTDAPDYADSLLSTDDPFRKLAAKEELEAISRLPPLYRDAVFAKGVGCTEREMMDMFDICEGTVKSRRHRGRALAREAVI